MRRERLMSLLRFGCGREVDPEGLEGHVVHLAAGAHQQNEGLWGRLCQHLAHALRCAADACDASNHDRGAGVGGEVVPVAPVQNQAAGGAQHHAVELGGAEGALDQTDDEVLVIYEGVERHHDGLAPVYQVFRLCGQRGADDAHGLSRPVALKGYSMEQVSVWPDVEARDAA
jgi:hypothetical protein